MSDGPSPTLRPPTLLDSWGRRRIALRSRYPRPEWLTARLDLRTATRPKSNVRHTSPLEAEAASGVAWRGRAQRECTGGNPFPVNQLVVVRRLLGKSYSYYLRGACRACDVSLKRHTRALAPAPHPGALPARGAAPSSPPRHPRRPC